MTDNADPSEVQNLEAELSGNPVTEPEVPPQFKGKSTNEIIEILKNTQSELGRKNNEVGQLRRLTDEVLGLAKASRDVANQQTKKPITSDDILTDPDKVVTERMREVADERAQVTHQRMAQMEGQLALNQFERKFPTYEQDLHDSRFQQWVTGTDLRKHLAQRAASGDFTAADELFSLYGEIRPKTGDATGSNLDAARKASLAKGGGSAVVDTSGSGKKVYKRTELIDMRAYNPDEYHRRFESEFLPAYKEGRVK